MHPRATSVQPGPLKSVIYRYSPWQSPPQFWDDGRMSFRLAGGWSPEDPAAEGELSLAVTQRRSERSRTATWPLTVSDLGASRSAPTMK